MPLPPVVSKVLEVANIDTLPHLLSSRRDFSAARKKPFNRTFHVVSLLLFRKAYICWDTHQEVEAPQKPPSSRANSQCVGFRSQHKIYTVRAWVGPGGKEETNDSTPESSQRRTFTERNFSARLENITESQVLIVASDLNHHLPATYV